MRGGDGGEHPRLQTTEELVRAQELPQEVGRRSELRGMRRQRGRLPGELLRGQYHASPHRMGHVHGARRVLQVLAGQEGIRPARVVHEIEHEATPARETAFGHETTDHVDPEAPCGCVIGVRIVWMGQHHDGGPRFLQEARKHVRRDVPEI